MNAVIMEERALIDPVVTKDALLQAFVMIVVSEIGDKTFLIAAIMATRHARVTVFGGAFASLVVMSVLSAALGKVILGLIPKVWTLWAAAILFLAFGVKMLQEAVKMQGGNSHIQDEMREVEEELEEDSSRHDLQNPSNGSIPLEDVEAGKAGNGLEGLNNDRMSMTPGSPSRRARSASPRVGSPNLLPLSGSRGMGASPNRSSKQQSQSTRQMIKSFMQSTRNALQMMTNPVFAQAFILTFLGEWGDRSQITTIAMAGAHSVPVIAFGTIMGHGVCTCGAVIGGRYLSTKISVKHITLIGAAAFLIFAILYVMEALYNPNDEYTSGITLR